MQIQLHWKLKTEGIFKPLSWYQQSFLRREKKLSIAFAFYHQRCQLLFHNLATRYQNLHTKNKYFKSSSKTVKKLSYLKKIWRNSRKPAKNIIKIIYQKKVEKHYKLCSKSSSQLWNKSRWLMQVYFLLQKLLKMQSNWIEIYCTFLVLIFFIISFF